MTDFVVDVENAGVDRLALSAFSPVGHPWSVWGAFSPSHIGPNPVPGAPRCISRRLSSLPYAARAAMATTQSRWRVTRSLSVRARSRATTGARLVPVELLAPVAPEAMEPASLAAPDGGSDSGTTLATSLPPPACHGLALKFAPIERTVPSRATRMTKSLHSPPSRLLPLTSTGGTTRMQLYRCCTTMSGSSVGEGVSARPDDSSSGWS